MPRRPGSIGGPTPDPVNINDGTLARTPGWTPQPLNPPLFKLEADRQKRSEAPKQIDLSQQLAELLGRRIFPVLLQTPSYTEILERAGVEPPYDSFDAARQARNPRFYQTWAVYARLIAGMIKASEALETSTLASGTLQSGETIYRLLGEVRAPDPTTLLAGTNYVGDWWFEQKLWLRVLKDAGDVDPEATDMSTNRIIRARLRSLLAIAIDWSKGMRVVRLTIPSGGELPVITGVGRPMPAYSAGQAEKGTKAPAPGKFLGSLHMRFRHIVLPGGYRQYWVPFTPNEVPILTERDLSE